MTPALLTLVLLALLWLRFALGRRRVDKARHAVAAAYDRRQRVRRPVTEAEMAQRLSMLNAPHCYPGIMQSPLLTHPMRPSDD